MTRRAEVVSVARSSRTLASAAADLGVAPESVERTLYRAGEHALVSRLKGVPVLPEGTSSLPAVRAARAPRPATTGSVSSGRGLEAPKDDQLEAWRAARAFARAVLGDGDDDDWREQAVCAQTDPDAFFPDKGEGSKPAKRICAECPVRTQCLDEALENGERFGVWGGLSERERRKVLRERGVELDEEAEVA